MSRNTCCTETTSVCLSVCDIRLATNVCQFFTQSLEDCITSGRTNSCFVKNRLGWAGANQGVLERRAYLFPVPLLSFPYHHCDRLLPDSLRSLFSKFLSGFLTQLGVPGLASLTTKFWVEVFNSPWLQLRYFGRFNFDWLACLWGLVRRRNKVSAPGFNGVVLAFHILLFIAFITTAIKL